MFRQAAASLLVLGALLVPPLAEAGGAKISGWVLQQEQPHTGVWKIYLAPAGMAAVNDKMGCTLVTKAPQWNVVMYNDKTKVYFLSPLSEWNGASLKNASVKTGKEKQQLYKAMLVEKKPKKLKDGTILGHKASQYLTDNLASTGLKKVEFWVTPDVQAPPELKQVFSKIYGVGLSSMQGLPLRVSYIDENGKRTPVFDTKSVLKQDIPLSSFTYPSTYKRVDSEIAVLMDQKGREAMASIMDDIGDGEGEDVGALLEGDGKKKSKTAKSTETDSLEDPEDKGSAGEEPEKKTSGNNGDWMKGITDWFDGIMKFFASLFGGKPESSEAEVQ